MESAILTGADHTGPYPWAVLQGSTVLLRPGRAADLDALESIFAAPEVSAWWARYDRARIEAEVLRSDDPAETVYVIEVDGAVAGVIQSYEEAEPEYRAAGIDIAVAPRWHGTGVALDAIRTLARHLLEDKGHHHLTIDPAAGNARAIAAYAKVGFRPVGVLRQNELGPDGTFHDTLLMDLVTGELQ
jgi:aminoglycoside 6'-N-acetyltransferase